MVRKADQPDGVRDFRGSRHVSEPGARQGECLAHGARDDQTLASGQQGQGARSIVVRELVVSLIHDHNGLARFAGLIDGLDDVKAQACTRGVIG
ncbi:hypothetical protein D3C73_1434440 [compost metagenome]